MLMKVGLGNDPGSSWGFLADPVVVSIATTGQKVLVTSSKAFGTSSDLGSWEGAMDLDLAICHQLDAGAITVVGGGVWDLRAARDTRQLNSLSATLTNLTPGTYNIGLCGKSDDASNWNSNEFSYTTAFVTQP
jgi:hypothetical protein